MRQIILIFLLGISRIYSSVNYIPGVQLWLIINAIPDFTFLVFRLNVASCESLLRDFYWLNIEDCDLDPVSDQDLLCIVFDQETGIVEN